MINLIFYKIYKFRLNWINKRRLGKGMLPISDSKGYPYKNYQNVNVVPLPLPNGKMWYGFDKRIIRKTKLNKIF